MASVENVRDTYGKVITDIDNATQSIRSDIAALQTQVSDNLPSYYGANVGDYSVGAFVTDFELALDRWQSSIDSLIGPKGAFTVALNDLDGKLSQLRTRKGILDRMCTENTTREHKYTIYDIPF